MKKSKAFTLIELLVVIAIIGLLSSVVLLGVKTARDKAQDGAIMRELSQVRTIAQMILVEDGAYNELCDAANTLNDGSLSYPGLKEIEDRVGSLNGGNDVTCYASGELYCVSSPLVFGIVFCFDSEGIASTVKTCNATDKICK